MSGVCFYSSTVLYKHVDQVS